MHGRIGNWKTTETKADPFTLDSLVAWLEKQPARKGYNYEDCLGKCLYGQYGAAHGISWNESGATCSIYATPEANAFCALVYDKVASCKPWTFGAALSRAKAALAVQT